MMKWMYDLQMHGVKEGDEVSIFGYINNLTQLDDTWYIGRVNATPENILGHMIKFRISSLPPDKVKKMLLRDAIIHCTLRQRNSMCHVLEAHSVILGQEVKQ